MAKKITGYIKLQIPAGKATPAPPVGPALGQHGVNIPAFTKEFNARTANQAGMIIPVVITVYQDKTFTFVLDSPGSGSAEEGCEDRVWFRQAEYHEGCEDHQGSGEGDRGAEDAGSECGQHRGGHEHDRGYREKHGHCCRGLIISVLNPCPSAVGRSLKEDIWDPGAQNNDV